MTIETAWYLEKPSSLKFSKFLVHVFKNGDPVHTYEESSGKSNATFSVPGIFEYESNDLYEVLVEGVRECDSNRIASERKKCHHQRCVSLYTKLFMLRAYCQ